MEVFLSGWQMTSMGAIGVEGTYVQCSVTIICSKDLIIQRLQILLHAGLLLRGVVDSKPVEG